MTLNIHSIESFGTVDGPGVRFVIFVQGCPLRCAYCHNPDTWKQNMGKQTDIDDLLKQIDDYSIFLKNGGVTISGGEPLLYAKELLYLFKKLKQKGIHTCIDTSGYIPLNDTIKELLDYTDLLLLDIKVFDEQKHKDLTGVSNQNILSFARYLSDIEKPVWIRHVLVPTVNNSNENITQLKRFIDTLNNVSKIELIPYHSMGVFKWRELGLEYKMSHIKAPTKQEMEDAKTILGISETQK